MRAADDADFTTGDVADAEDLLQTALERAYRRWPSIRHAQVPEAYVRRIVVTSAINARRRRGVRNAPLDEAQLAGRPDATVEDTAGRVTLAALVRQLPVGQRAVLVLRYFDDLTEAETARVLGCTVGTVKSQHARAMARLRELLADQPYESRT
jgi:RNA polymerase sigma-70 factor (sigma-E family)